jgi:hypothetical protein
MSEQDDTTVETDDVDDSDDGDTGDADKLGDAGKKALDSMKSKWQKERDARKALEAKMAADSKPDDQQDPAEMRKQAQAEARAEVLKDRALDKVEAKAAKLFADPEDARALLASRVDDFVDDGQVDVDAINEALTDLLSKKPHLAAATAKRFQGGADGGARKGSQVSQLTEQDLTRMTPQQIDKARLDGRLNDLLGVS